MHVSRDEADWIRSITALTVQPDGDCPADRLPDQRLHEAERAVRQLAALSRSLVGDGDSSETCACAEQPCAFAHDFALARACALAADLARQAPGTERVPLPGPKLWGAYLEALGHAAEAVYFCRRVGHASNHCWFSTGGPAGALCGRVLATAHNLRQPV